jgi:hypothetical protein
VTKKISERSGIEPGGQVDVGLIHGNMKTGVNVFFGLILYRRYDLGMTVPHIVDADAAGKLDEFSPINIGHSGASGLLDENGGGIEGALGDMLGKQFQKFFVSVRHHPFSSSSLKNIEMILFHFRLCCRINTRQRAMFSAYQATNRSMSSLCWLMRFRLCPRYPN